MLGQATDSLTRRQINPRTRYEPLWSARRVAERDQNTHPFALEQAEATLQAAIDEVNAFFADDWASYQQAVEAAEVSLFETFEPLELEQ